MTGYRNRELAPLIHEALRSLPVVVVTGLHKVGKTTLLQGDAHLYAIPLGLLLS